MSCRSDIIRIGVYCAIFFKIVGGAYNLVHGSIKWIEGRDDSVIPLLIVCGALLCILCGIILFCGIFWKRQKYVLAYLVIVTPNLLIATMYCVAMCYLSVLFLILLVLLLTLEWPVHICVFLFYRDIKEKERNRRSDDESIQPRKYDRERTSTM